MDNLIHLTKSQSKFMMADKKGDNKAIALVTGFGGGKTMVLTIKLIELALKFPNHDIIYLMPTYSMFRNVLHPMINEILGDSNIDFKINKTLGEIHIGSGVGRVIQFSMDQPETIVGVNALAAFLDELDTLQMKKAEQVWQKTIGRCRKAVPVLDEDGNQIPKPTENDPNAIELHLNRMYVGTTPEGMRFMHKMFVKNKPDNYLLIQASGRENTYLPIDYYDNLKAIYPENLVDAYIEGKFVNMASGNVYKNFDRELCDTNETYSNNEAIFVSLDFNVHNCNSVIFVKRNSLEDQDLSQHGYKYNTVQTMHAVDHLSGIVDTPETIKVIKEKYPGAIVTCYPDSSGKNASTRGFTTSDVSLLKQAGFRVKYPKKNPPIMDRVLAVNSALKTGLIKINVLKCPKLADALEEQAYSEATGLPEKFPGASIDDITDAFGYIVHFLFPVNRKTMSSKDYKGK